MGMNTAVAICCELLRKGRTIEREKESHLQVTTYAQNSVSVSQDMTQKAETAEGGTIL
jgi:hypothetical protein